MDWKDTVMKPEKILSVPNWDGIELNPLLESQAEISFKAGWTARGEQCKEDVWAHGNICYKAGRREVVEYLAEKAYKQFATDQDLHLNYSDYQELKEEVDNGS